MTSFGETNVDYESMSIEEADRLFRRIIRRMEVLQYIAAIFLLMCLVCILYMLYVIFIEV